MLAEPLDWVPRLYQGRFLSIPMLSEVLTLFYIQSIKDDESSSWPWELRQFSHNLDFICLHKDSHLESPMYD